MGPNDVTDQEIIDELHTAFSESGYEIIDLDIKKIAREEETG